MGYQIGLVRIRGKVGNLIFSRTPNGDEVRTQTSLNAERLRTDPKFKRTRENWVEFTRAVNAGKLIRHTFARHYKQIADSKGHSRLLAHTMRVVKSDYLNDRGKRQLNNGNFNNLLGYEFNARQNLESTFNTPFEIQIDRTAGTALINISAFIPSIDIAAMPGATHFKLMAATAAFDWDQQKATPAFIESTEIALNNPSTTPQSLTLNFPPESDKTLIVTLGIWFYQEVNSQLYQLSNGSMNAMAIVGVDHK